ncbi:MAG: DUF262 domain-containing protein [Kineosporiaceae bacterium]|nr:DUF262 domain-containing protein [Aeromicrobium sp.]
MDAHAKSFQLMFQGTSRYNVPLYQRPYVWKHHKEEPEKDRLGPYWADVKETIDAFVAHSRLVKSAAGDASKVAAMTPHFFGAVVIDGPVKEGQITTHEVIDGQQRLTTTLLFLAAATRLCEKHDKNSHASRLRKLWRQDDDIDVEGLSRFKMTPTRQDQRGFLAVMDDQLPLRAEKSNITDAYAFFVAELDEWVDNLSADETSEYFDALRDTIYEHLILVAIELGDGDNPQGIFESLNAQGEKLLALDLVKNEVFRRGARANLDLDKLDREVWSPRFAVSWWRAEVKQGRYRRPRAELFLMHWLIDQKGGDVSATGLYVEFQAIARRDIKAPSEVATFIDRFVADADRYRKLDSLPAGSREALFFQRRAILDVSVVYPLTLRLWRLFDEGGITRDRLLTALAALESWLVRRMAVGDTAKNYNNVIVSILNQMGTAGESAADPVGKLINYLRDGDDKTRWWPGDDRFRERFTEHALYKSMTRPRERFFLEVIEARMLTPKTESVSFDEDLTIEHVIPQTWEKTWPLPQTNNEEERIEAEKRRNSHVHRLGNLSLVTGSLNPAIGNNPWAEKRKEIERFSKLRLNAELLADYPSIFDETAINRRSAKLVERLIEEWPGPDSPIWK